MEIEDEAKPISEQNGDKSDKRKRDSLPSKTVASQNRKSPSSEFDKENVQIKSEPEDVASNVGDQEDIFEPAQIFPPDLLHRR